MKITGKPLYIVISIIIVLVLSACSKNAENEHLPEYCQTYSGFVDVASADLFELIYEQGEEQEYITRFNYLSVIATNKLEFDMDDPSREMDLGGIQCFQNLTSLTLRGRSFKDISQVSALSNIQSLVLENTSVVSIDSFKNLSKINSLSITGTKTLQSVEGVGEMTKLTTLDLSDNGLVNIGELNALVNLENLYLNDNGIVYFPSISNLRSLEYLDISNNNIIQLGEDLSGLSALVSLDAANNEICDLSTLDDLLSLVTLDLGFNDLGCGGIGVSPDFDSLENAPYLETLILNDNNLTSIEGLRGRNISLTTLYLNNNQLTDITPIGEYTDITTLLLYNNNIVNIDDLSGMTGLTSIDLSENNIVDFSDLLTIPNIETVYLGSNQIAVIPDLSLSWTSLKYLDLQDNVLTDTSGLNGHPSIEIINLYNNELNELSGVSNMPELIGLILFEEDMDDLETDDIAAYDVELYEVEIERLNAISIITNSFNNLPKLLLHVSNVFDFGFPVEDNLEIYNSIKGLTTIATIDFSDMNIDVIDEFSIELPGLSVIRVQDNNITDIRFILGNPNLEQITLSNNNISNLEVISGFATSDLDNLTDVIAMNITADNNLLDAFIDLPNLETIALTDTSIVSINNCFNNLVSLEILLIDSFNLESIEDSFNNIFDTYLDSNEFIFADGKIGLISNSFNGGNYEVIGIQSQIPVIGGTLIEDSFNDITLEGTEGLVIQNSNFVSITGSFNNVVTDQLLLNNNDTETITTSLVGSTIVGLLDLSDNKLETVPTLNQVTSVDEVDLNHNYLSTLSFIDTVPDLTTLDISFQRNPDLLVYTLASFDGVNNQPLLTSMTYSEIGVPAIDGLRNTGLTSLDFSLDTNNISIATVSATSFTGTALTYLDLDEQGLSDLTFLSNLSVLENLYIGIDLPDLSDFQGQTFESTLEILVIHSAQDISDLSYLVDYDTVTGLTISGDLVDSIDNLNGMDSLVTLSVPLDQILTITNSFNALSSFNPSISYLGTFDNLATVDTSFDLFDDEINITSDYNVIDSFNNVLTVNLDDNNGETLISFDALSFDSMTNIVLEFASYTNYNFLNGYTALTDVTIGVLSTEITDLANDNITSLEITSALSSIGTFTLDLAPNASFALTSSRTSTITITGDMGVYDVTASNADVTINSTATTITFAGDYEDFILSSGVTTNVQFGDFESNSVIFNTDALTTVTRSTTFPTNAITFTVNSDQATLNLDVRAEDVIINNDTATVYTLNIDPGSTDTGNVTINSVLPDLQIDFNGEDLFVSYNTLESLDITGSFNGLSSNSNVLDVVNLNTSTVDTLIITSQSANLNISSTTAQSASILDNNLENLTLTLPSATSTVTTSNNQSIVLIATTDELSMVGSSIPDITVDDSSVVTTLELLTTNSITTLDYGTATIGSIDFTSNQASITITGDTASAINIDGVSYTDLILTAPLSGLTVNDLASTVNLNATVNTINLIGTGFTTLNLNTASTANSITVTASNSFATFNSNDAIVGSIDVTSQAPTMNLDIVNVTATTIDNLNISTITIDSGTNTASLNSQGLGSISAEVIAATFSISANADIVTIDNASTITTLNLSSQNLSDVIAGTATLGTINITQSSTALDVSGSSIANLDINALVNTLDINTGLTTNVVVSTASSTTFVSTISTEAIDLTANVNSTINGVNLETVDLTLGSNDLVIDADSPILNLSILGTAGEVTITGDDVDNLTFDGTTNLNKLILTNLDFDTLDLSAGSIDNIEIDTTKTSFDLTGNSLTETIINGNALTAVTINSTSPTAELTLTSSQTTMTLTGSIDAIDYTNSSLTSIDLSGITVNDLVLDTTSLATLDTLTSVATLLNLTTIQNNFNLTTNTPSVTFNGGITDTLNLTSTLTGTMTLSTLVDTVDITAATTDFIVNGTNLNNVSGSLNDIDLTATSNGVFNFDVAAGNITYGNDSGTTLIFSGTTTANSVEIESTSLTTITTNAATMDSLVYNLGANSTDITTNTDQIEVESSGSGSITLQYDGATALDLTLTSLDTAEVTLTTATSVDVNGDLDTLDITGTSIDTITTNATTISSLVYNFAANATNITTNAPTIELESSSSGSITLSYGGASALDLTLTTLDSANITLTTASSLDVEGSLEDLTVIGTSIDTVATELLTVNNKYTMNNTLIDDITFVSTELLANVDEIEVNSLVIGNIDTILAKLGSSTITLRSPITDLDLYNYYYNSEYATLEATETGDSARYNQFRSDAVDAAWAAILTNTYMAHLDETVTKAEIDAQVYQSVEDYFQSYLTNEGTDEVTLGVTESTNARNAITATLADPLLTIVELTLQGQVTTSIEDDADVYALAEQAAETFTIAN